MLRFIALAPPLRPPWTRWERASAILLLILAQGIFADWIAHLLLAATSAINWAEPPAVGLAGSFVSTRPSGAE